VRSYQEGKSSGVNTKNGEGRRCVNVLKGAPPARRAVARLWNNYSAMGLLPGRRGRSDAAPDDANVPKASAISEFFLKQFGPSSPAVPTRDKGLKVRLDYSSSGRRG